MMNKNTLTFAFRYGELPHSLRSIIEYLYHNKVFVGNYAELARELGLKTSKCKAGVATFGGEPNVRKRILKLAAMGIVEVEQDKNSLTQFSKVIRLTTNWTEKV